ncbi:GH14733 [Drosophila grimshawi]|uniref:GH14733 n=1 Tax=Drosophila grimshawi TaxID=7222 RepID=B4IWW9_DROGR|nr:GH14733 [Drosophila grimshawi]
MATNRKRKKTVGTSASGLKSVVKWKIMISSIMLLLLFAAQVSHVLAVRRGRLMSPSTFTALSGDLHVQIQFTGEDENENDGIGNGHQTNITELQPTNHSVSSNAHLSTARPDLGRGSKTATEGMVNTIMSTLVISKIVNDAATSEGEPLLPQNTTNSSNTSSSSSSTNQIVLQRRRKEVVQNIPLFPDPRQNITQVTVPCQTFVRGGLYEMQVVRNLKTTTLNRSDPIPGLTTTTLMPTQDERLLQTLDVRWPSAEMIVSPVTLRTYPKAPVKVTLRFPEVNCERALHGDQPLLPEFWLELVYCGKERTCAPNIANVSKSSVLFAEQVHGYPKLKTLQLGCELFGLAGNYVVQLRPMTPALNVPTTRRMLSVDWSNEYVFNVYARSIFPCDPHSGVGVLYEYPGCILEQGDRVRLYAKLRADVASLKPPTSLHYVAEQRVVKSQHSLYFSCDLFTEKYVEYCFVYVSQAISGAVADVRMDCVPTLPVSDSDTGGWGTWSEWTPCSTNCLGGTRNRYRFCDSPPPRYGAKFCEGPSVQSEKCNQTAVDTWDCIYETSGNMLTKSNVTEVHQEIGPGCRCGCIVHLGSTKPKRMIAGATQNCPGRSFWLIQVDGEETIWMQLSFLRLPCGTQYIKVRDGPSLSSTLLVELKGDGATMADIRRAPGEDGSQGGLPLAVESSGAQLLVEFYSGDMTGNSTSNAGYTAAACTGGFMANVKPLVPRTMSNGTTILASTRLSVKSRNVLQKKSLAKVRFTLVHLSAMVFATIIIIISALLGAQYMVRYRKYHLAVARRQDEGSQLHTPRDSLSSLHGPPSRAISTTTLLSEVIYLVKMRPKHKLRHSILRESADVENVHVNETQFQDDAVREQVSKGEEAPGFGSTASMMTIRNEHASLTSLSPATDSLSPVGSPSSGEPELQRNEEETGQTVIVQSPADPASSKDSAKDSESIISSGMSSLCNSPPLNSHRMSKYSDRYDAVTLKLLSSRLDESLRDARSVHSGSGSLCLGRMGSRSVSASLTNGCYSPAASVVSTATIRTTSNPKESKEKQNRRKLLARPGSEFSLGNQEELELDYYDYNVINAGAAPGSYLGMDPAYCIWIPPFEETAEREDEDKTPEPMSVPEEANPSFADTQMPKYGHLYLSPAGKSNTTDSTPSSEERSLPSSQQQSKATSPSEPNQKSTAPAKQPTPFMSRKQRRQARQQFRLACAGNESESGTLRSKPAVDIAEVHQSLIKDTNQSMSGSYVEKETLVEKGSSDLQDYLALDDIQFADESGSDYEAATLKQQMDHSATKTLLDNATRTKSKEAAV